MSVPSGKAPDRPTALRWIGTLVTLALLLYVLGKYRADIWLAFRQIPPWRLALGLGLMMVSRLAVVARWYVLLRSGGVKMTVGECTRITFAGLFSNNFLPTTIGGDVVRLAGAVQLHYDGAVCTASLIVDRLVGMAGMAMALPFGLPRFLQAQSLSPSHPSQVSHFLLGFGMLPLGNLWKRAWNKVVELTQRILSALALWLKQPRGLLLALVCSWVNMLCLFAFLYLMFAGMGEPLPFWLTAGLYSMVYFVTLIPISINGYGLQEVSMTLVFSRFGGASVANGVTAALLFRTLMMLTSLPGALFLPGMLAGGRAEDKPGQP
jgi:uncharacterized membrane protein YbhN (UPF0104 family)